MSTVPTRNAQQHLQKLLDSVAQNHEPVIISGKRNDGVLIGIEDWRAIQETLHLAQIPGMIESIKEGLATPATEMSEDAGW